MIIDSRWRRSPSSEEKRYPQPSVESPTPWPGHPAPALAPSAIPHRSAPARPPATTTTTTTVYICNMSDPKPRSSCQSTSSGVQKIQASPTKSASLSIITPVSPFTLFFGTSGVSFTITTITIHASGSLIWIPSQTPSITLPPASTDSLSPGNIGSQQTSWTVFDTSTTTSTTDANAVTPPMTLMTPAPTTSPTLLSTSLPLRDKHSSLINNAGAIAGIAIGSALALAFIALWICLALRTKKRRRRLTGASTKLPNPHSPLSSPSSLLGSDQAIMGPVEQTHRRSTAQRSRVDDDDDEDVMANGGETFLEPLVYQHGGALSAGPVLRSDDRLMLELYGAPDGLEGVRPSCAMAGFPHPYSASHLNGGEANTRLAPAHAHARAQAAAEVAAALAPYTQRRLAEDEANWAPGIDDDLDVSGRSHGSSGSSSQSSFFRLRPLGFAQRPELRAPGEGADGAGAVLAPENAWFGSRVADGRIVRGSARLAIMTTAKATTADYGLDVYGPHVTQQQHSTSVDLVLPPPSAWGTRELPPPMSYRDHHRHLDHQDHQDHKHQDHYGYTLNDRHVPAALDRNDVAVVDRKKWKGKEKEKDPPEPDGDQDQDYGVLRHSSSSGGGSEGAFTGGIVRPSSAWLAGATTGTGMGLVGTSVESRLASGSDQRNTSGSTLGSRGSSHRPPLPPPPLPPPRSYSLSSASSRQLLRPTILPSLPSLRRPRLSVGSSDAGTANGSGSSPYAFAPASPLSATPRRSRPRLSLNLRRLTSATATTGAPSPQLQSRPLSEGGGGRISWFGAGARARAAAVRASTVGTLRDPTPPPPPPPPAFWARSPPSPGTDDGSRDDPMAMGGTTTTEGLLDPRLILRLREGAQQSLTSFVDHEDYARRFGAVLVQHSTVTFDALSHEGTIV